MREVMGVGVLGFFLYPTWCTIFSHLCMNFFFFYIFFPTPPTSHFLWSAGLLDFAKNQEPYFVFYKFRIIFSSFDEESEIFA